MSDTSVRAKKRKSRTPEGKADGAPIPSLLDKIIPSRPPGRKMNRGRGRGRNNSFNNNFYNNRSQSHSGSQRTFTRFSPSMDPNSPPSVSDFVNFLPTLQHSSTSSSVSYNADTELYCANTMKRLASLSGSSTQSSNCSVQPLVTNKLSRDDAIKKVRQVVISCHSLLASQTNSYSVVCLLVSHGLNVELLMGKLVSAPNVDLVLDNKDHMYRCVVHYEHLKTIVDSSNSIVATEVASREFIKSLNSDCSMIPVIGFNLSLLIPFGVVKFIDSVCDKIPFDWQRTMSKVDQSQKRKEFPTSNKLHTYYVATYKIGEYTFRCHDEVEQFAKLKACQKAYNDLTSEKLPRVRFFIGHECVASLTYDSKLQDIRYHPSDDKYETDEVNPHEMDSFEKVWTRSAVLRQKVHNIIQNRHNGNATENQEEEPGRLQHQRSSGEFCELS